MVKNKTIQEQIEVMQHFANGGEIQYNDGIGWCSKNIPDFNWIDYDYRIKKPRVTVTIEKWLTYNKMYDNYSILETSKIDIIIGSVLQKVKLLDSYEVEVDL